MSSETRWGSQKRKREEAQERRVLLRKKAVCWERGRHQHQRQLPLIRPIPLLSKAKKDRKSENKSEAGRKNE